MTRPTAESRAVFPDGAALDIHTPGARPLPILRFDPDNPTAWVEVAALIDGLREGIATLQRLREQMLDRDLCWVLPVQVIGEATLYGLPVYGADVPYPMLAHRAGGWPQ